MLKNLYNHFVRHEESRWILGANDAQILYNFIKENTIKNVLDLGSGIGCSAAIAALALEKDYSIVGLEQFPKCIKIAKKLIPKELKNIKIIQSNAVVWNTDKIPHQSFSVFKKIPEKEYDLIIVDGPGPFMDKNHLIDLPNGDIIKLLLEDKIKPGTFIAWDQRLRALSILERYFSENFYLCKRSPDGKFHILQRKNNPMIFKDETLEIMRQLHYFENMPTANSKTPQGAAKTANKGTKKTL